MTSMVATAQRDGVAGLVCTGPIIPTNVRPEIVKARIYMCP